MKRVINICLVLLLVFSFSFSTKAVEYQNGEVVNQLHSISNDDVMLTKEVKSVGNDIYQVNLKVKGSNKTITNSITEPIYAVVVFDKSGSMGDYTCNKTQADAGKCERGKRVLKYTNAKLGAKKFAESLFNKFPNSHIAYAMFSNSSTSTPFYNSYQEVESQLHFGYVYGDTALSKGLESANNLLDSIEGNNKYIIIMSDGEPNHNDDYQTQVDIARQRGYNIYAIGYEDEGTTLKTIVGDTTHYSDGNVDNIIDTFSNIANSISVTVPSLSRAIVEDVIGSDFEYITNSSKIDDQDIEPTINDKKISFNIDSLDDNTHTISFKIRLKNKSIGLHQTNEKASITYDDIDENNNQLVINDSPQVYIKPYTYKVNYLEKGTDKILSNQKIVNNSLFGNTYSEDALDIKGYNVDYNSKEISISSDNQEITFYYTKRNDLSYKIEYYYDNKLDDNETETVNNIEYGSIISDYPDKVKEGYYLDYTTGPITIEEDNNVLKVYYKKINKTLIDKTNDGEDSVQVVSVPNTNVKEYLDITLLVIVILSSIIILLNKGIIKRSN